MGSPALDRAYQKALKAAADSKKAVFTGWTCPSGPEEFVWFLVDNGKVVSYRTFAKNVDLKTAALEPWQRKMLSTDWSVTFLRTKLPSGSEAWVMQHGGIEHLFLRPGIEFDRDAEVALIP
mgnify:CR=1 FL=1